MKHIVTAFYGALLVLGLAGIVPDMAAAQDGNHWDTVCNCRRPDSEYNTRHMVRAAPRVVVRERVVDHTRVVRGNTRLIQENRLIVHVRPVINREVVVHRTNTVVRDVVLHKSTPSTGSKKCSAASWSAARSKGRFAMWSSGAKSAA